MSFHAVFVSASLHNALDQTTADARFLRKAGDFMPKFGKPNIIYILADDMGYGDISCLSKIGCISRLSFKVLPVTQA